MSKLMSPRSAPAVLGLCALTASACAQTIPLSPAAQASGARVTYEQGIELVTIGSPNNAAWAGTTPPTRGDEAVGRGSVSYEYRIGRMEVTTAQWAEFVNAAMDRPASDRLPHLNVPLRWGAAPAPSQNGGQRFAVVAGRELSPAGGITWRMAAMYCNWLHNDRSSDRSAFLSGAYDVSTFAYTPGGRILDQLTRSPGARFFIPSWDEWIKAVHFDPNKAGPGQAGWWQGPITADSGAIGGPPGRTASVITSGIDLGLFGPDPLGRATSANFGWTSSSFPGSDPFAVPLGAYPQSQSPWGLLDASGATSEWVEEPSYGVPGDPPTDRLYDGTAWNLGGAIGDRLGFPQGGELPSVFFSDFGFRVAAAVPSPSACWVVAGVCWLGTKRRRR